MIVCLASRCLARPQQLHRAIKFAFSAIPYFIPHAIIVHAEYEEEDSMPV